MSISISIRGLERIIAQAEAAAEASAPAATAFERLLAQQESFAHIQQNFFANYGGAAIVADTLRNATYLPSLMPSSGIEGLLGETAVFRQVAAEMSRTSESLTATARETYSATSAIAKMAAEGNRSLYDVVQSFAALADVQYGLTALADVQYGLVVPEFRIAGSAARYLGGTSPFEHTREGLAAVLGMAAPAGESSRRPRNTDRPQRQALFSVEAYAQVGDVSVGDVAGRDLIKTEHYHLTEKTLVQVEVRLAIGEQSIILATGRMPLTYLPGREVELDHSVLVELNLKVPRTTLPRILWVARRRLCFGDEGHYFVIEVQAL